MKLHWWKRDDVGLARAREAFEASNESLEEAHARWPQVHSDAAWARETRQQNHLTELFFATRGNRG